jgi:sugar transferase (PEP-CTERM/EpsH1 system associated)
MSSGQQSARRPRILYLVHRLPYAPNRGDRMRTYHTLRALRPVADVHVVSLVHDAEEASHVEEVRTMASSVRTARIRHWPNRLRAIPGLLTGTPLTHVLLHAPDMAHHIREVIAEARPDLVVAFCSGIADHVLESPLSEFPLLVDMVDIDSAKWASLAAARPWWHPLRFIYAREARVLSQFEAGLTRHAKATIVISERERDLLCSFVPNAPVHVVPSGIDCERLEPQGPPSPDPVVVFCGVMNYEPNEQGMLWFINQIWPLVLAERPDATLQIVGSNPTPALISAGANARNVSVTGSVPRVEPYLWQSAVAVAPLLVARGMQNKVVEALGAGLPVVVSPQVAAGLPACVMPGCVEASQPEDFARRVVELLVLTPDQRRARARTADVAAMSWSRVLRPLVDIVQSTLRR